MKKNNLKQSLFDNGLIEEGNSDKIKAFKKAYRADYKQTYNKEYREKTVRKTLIFNEEEFSYLSEQAKKHQLKLSPFLKAVIFAYLDSSFVFPEKQTLSNIEQLLREINNRVAQSIQYIHLSRDIKIEDIQNLKQQISQVEFFVSNSLKNPPRLEIWISQQMKNDELFIPKLLQNIAKFIT